MNATELMARRDRMVAEQIEARGVRDPRVLAAMRKIPRERFVDDAMRERAYDDGPLPIGLGQTISQPYMVARMSELARLDGRERVLEVGAGSGYQTAVLCELARSIYAVEVRHELAKNCQRRLAILGYRNVEVGCFDGTHGWRERGPFDVILVAAGAPAIPPLLVDQLSDGGRLLIPVGSRQQQRLALVTRRGDDFDVDWNTPCTFVDLIGRFGWGGAGAPKA